MLASSFFRNRWRGPVLPLCVCFWLVCFTSAQTGYAAQAVYPPSPVVQGVVFDMSTVDTRAPGSDNWAITWADDDHQYTTWGDGGGFGGTNSEGRVSLGFARVQGAKRAYSGYNVWGGRDAENAAQFEGKSYGILSVNGVLYMWRTGDGSDDSAFLTQELFRSTDHAAMWVSTGVRFQPADFPGSPGFFAPTFLQFGKDYAGARDGYVYVYAPENKNNEWNVQRPGEIALLRVPKTQIDQRSAYQFFAGLSGAGEPIWSSEAGQRKPVFRDAENGVMRTSVSYNAGLKRYFLITQQVDRLRDGDGHIGIYDAPQPWGPWTTVLFADPWSLGLQTGSKTVFWNFSSKWLSADGLSFVLVYTGPSEDAWGTVEGKFLIDEPSGPPAPPRNLRVMLLSTSF